MGFFGMLIAIVSISIVLLFAREAAMLHAFDMIAYADNAYTNMQSIDTFYEIIEQTAPSNALQYGNWLNALKTCAFQNGINIYIANSTIVISSSRKPYFSEAVSISDKLWP